MSRDFKLAMGLLFAVVILFCGGGEIAFQAVGHLAFGWIWNIREVWPRVRVNVGGVVLFVVALSLAAWLAHGICRWLWNDEAKPWRWKWTALGLATVMLMFVAGVAATGVVHQAGWLINSPVSLLKQTRGRELANRVKCANNLKQIGQAIALYRTEGGSRPTSRAQLARLVLIEDLLPAVFVCPSSSAENAVATQPIDLPAAIDDERHFSYIACPTPLLGPTGEERVVVYEPLDNHSDGINVLFEDGTTEFLVEDIAKNWLATLQATSQSASE